MKWIGAIRAAVCLVAVINLASICAQPVPGKIAVVSFNALVLDTNEARRDLGALEKKYAPRQAQLQALNGEIEAARKQLSDAGGSLSETERGARAQTLQTKEKQLERATEDFRNDTQADSQQAYQRVAEKVFTFVQEYARGKGYSAIIERGSDANPIVWYAAEGIDITGELIKAYNAKSGIPAPDADVRPPGPGSANPASPKPGTPPVHQP